MRINILSGKNKITSLIFSILTCFVFCIDFKKYSFDETFIFLQFHKIMPTGNDFMWLFLVVGIFFIYQYASNIQIQRKTKITLGITSAFFAAFTIVGVLCETFERWEIDLALFFILMVTYFAYFAIIYALLKMIFYHLFENNTPPPIYKKNTSKILLFFDNYTFACTFFITIICWLPFLIIFYPGSAVWDGFRSLTYFFGYVPWSNHHPVPISLLMGSCMKIGKMLGSNNLGIFIYNIFQVLVSILTFCNIQLFLKRIRASYTLRIVTLAYFALFPLWRMSYIFMKDPLYSMVIANFTIELAYITLNSSEYVKSKYRLIYFTILCICTCFTRNNGVYILFFTIIMLVIYLKNKLTLLNQIKIIAPSFIGIFLFSFCVHFLYPFLNIGDDSKRESKSIFYQQIGRYLKYYEDDLTEKEKDWLHETFSDSKNIGKKHYNPILSDPIKGRFYAWSSSNKLKQLWLNFFIKKPSVYFEAFFYHTATYYSLTYENISEGGECGIFPPIEIHINKIVNPNGDLNYFYPLNLNRQRRNHKYVRFFIKRLPGIGLLYNAPLYTYIMVLCFIAVILYRQKKKLIIFIPSIVTFLVALASPVNGSLRYFLPVLAITPILIGITLMKENTNENSDYTSGV